METYLTIALGVMVIGTVYFYLRARYWNRAYQDAERDYARESDALTNMRHLYEDVLHEVRGQTTTYEYALRRNMALVESQEATIRNLRLFQAQAAAMLGMELDPTPTLQSVLDAAWEEQTKGGNEPE